MQVGSWVGEIGAEHQTRLEVSGVVGVEVPVTEKLAPVVWLGAQRHPDGTLDPRDAVLGLSWTAISKPELVVRLQPGLNLPTGGIGSDLYFTPLSTSSVDPYLTGDVVYGSTWLVGALVVARAPLYDGWDRLRQGPFARVDLRGARRIRDLVPWVGVSAVRQAPSDPVGAAPDFTELAATVGTVANLSPRWSLTGQLRLPLLHSAEAHPQVGGGLSVRWVVGGAEDEEEHHPGDGHDHG